MKFFIILLSMYVNFIYAQVFKIGAVSFIPVNEKDKPAETVRGTVEVYENNFADTGKTIKINIEVLPAKSKDLKEAPMFIIAGGPGQAATDLISFFSEIFSEVNLISDLVFIDQRGTGKSNPLKLNAEFNNLQGYFEDELMSDEFIKNNYDSLSRINDLTSYGTINAVKDLEKIRDLMGYTKINLYGTSYGTRVVLYYIYTYPERVRTATLKGSIHDEYVIPHPFAMDSQRSLDMLIDDCMKNDSCRTNYPRLKNDLAKFFSNIQPVKFALENKETGKFEDIELKPDIINLYFRLFLSAPSVSAIIPYLIKQANNGFYNPLANLILQLKKSYIKNLYDGMSLCIVCYEDYPLLKNFEADLINGTFLKDYWIKRINTACRIWNSEKILNKRVKLTRQETHLLVISGNRDGIARPGYSYEILKYFPNGRHVIIEQGGHSFDGMRDCVEKIICDFVISGESSGIDTECTKKIKFPEYKLR